MAGGQGTRLGSSAPKGCYDLQLPSQKSLFQLFAERITRLEALANAPLNSLLWCIMTSDATHIDTERFFVKHAFFGRSAASVLFFSQANLPCVDAAGEVLLASPTQPAASPNGNGGVYEALEKHGVLAQLQAKGVEWVQFVGVDNVLCRIADPLLFGHCICDELQLSSKTCVRTSPTEATGLFCLRNGRCSIVEYSEIDAAANEQRASDDGQLLYRYANTVQHCMSLKLLKRICTESRTLLQPHEARKKIPHYDVSRGCVVKPDAPNGVKMELFLFDAFHVAEAFGLLAVEACDEFSPLKNGPEAASCNPQTARNSLFTLHKRWLAKHGIHFKMTPASAQEEACEVAPCVSYGGEGLEAFAGQSVSLPAHISHLPK